MQTMKKEEGCKESYFRHHRPCLPFYRVSGTKGQRVSTGAVSVWLPSGVRSRSCTLTRRYISSEKQWGARNPKTESSLKATAVGSMGDGKLAGWANGRLLSLRVLCVCRPVDRRGWVGWGVAVFSRRSFLCVGLMAPCGGRDPQSNLLSPQNTLCYKTHTPSGTDSALNFLPVILAAGQRKATS